MRIYNNDTETPKNDTKELQIDTANKRVRAVIHIAERRGTDNFFASLRTFQEALLQAKTAEIKNIQVRNVTIALMKTDPRYSIHGIAKKLANYALEQSVLPCELYKI